MSSTIFSLDSSDRRAKVKAKRLEKAKAVVIDNKASGNEEMEPTSKDRYVLLVVSSLFLFIPLI